MDDYVHLFSFIKKLEAVVKSLITPVPHLNEDCIWEMYHPCFENYRLAHRLILTELSNRSYAFHRSVFGTDKIVTRDLQKIENDDHLIYVVKVMYKNIVNLRKELEPIVEVL